MGASPGFTTGNIRGFRTKEPELNPCPTRVDFGKLSHLSLDFLIYKMGLELILGLKFRLIFIEHLVSDIKDV